MANIFMNENRLFEQLVRKMDPKNVLLRTWVLEGGFSAQVTALEIQQPDGQTKKMILRRHGEGDLKQNPNVAADEFRLLQRLRSAGLAAPTPYYLDPSGEIFPTPCIVLEYIDGESEFAPADVTDCLRQIAAYLSRIHQVSTLNLSLPPKPDVIQQRPEKTDDSLDEGRIRDTLEAVWPLPQHNQSVLLHGDFWPGNILWKNGQIAAVIDWEDAWIGDPLADLATIRLEILWAFGLEAMFRFTEFYQSINPINVTNLPYWDLYAALRPAFQLAEWAADSSAEQAMREGHRQFITQAFAKLPGSSQEF